MGSKWDASIPTLDEPGLRRPDTQSPSAQPSACKDRMLGSETGGFPTARLHFCNLEPSLASPVKILRAGIHSSYGSFVLFKKRITLCVLKKTRRLFHSPEGHRRARQHSGFFGRQENPGRLPDFWLLFCLGGLSVSLLAATLRSTQAAPRLVCRPAHRPLRPQSKTAAEASKHEQDKKRSFCQKVMLSTLSMSEVGGSLKSWLR